MISHPPNVVVASCLVASCLALLFACRPALAAGPGAGDPEASVEQASRLLKNQGYKQAIRICKQEVESRSRVEATQCLLILAIAYNRIGEPQEAIEAARQAAASTEDPRFVRVADRELGSAHFKKAAKLKSRGSFESASEQLKHAESAFRRALDIDQEGDHVTMIDLATTLFEQIHVGWIVLGEDSDWQQADVEIRELALSYLRLNPSGPSASWAREVGCVELMSALSSGSGEDEPSEASRSEASRSEESPSGESRSEEGPGSGGDSSQSTETGAAGQADQHVGEEVVKPEKISSPQPQYSPLARKARIQGQVSVQAVLNKRGNVTDIEVIKGLPLCLTQQALLAIREWKFQPATLHGRPVDVYYHLTVNFRLR